METLTRQPLATVQFTVQRAWPRLASFAHVEDHISTFLDAPPRVALTRATASRLPTFFERVASRYANDPQTHPSLYTFCIGCAMSTTLEQDDLAMIQTIHRLHPAPLPIRSLEAAFRHASDETIRWIFENRRDGMCCLLGTDDPCAGCLKRTFNNAFEPNRFMSWVPFDQFRSHLLEIAPKKMEAVQWLCENDLMTRKKAEQILREVIEYGPPDSADVVTYLVDRGYELKTEIVIAALLRGSRNPNLEPVTDVVVASHLCDPFRDQFVYRSYHNHGVRIVQWSEDFIASDQTYEDATAAAVLSRSTQYANLDLLRWLYDEGLVPVSSPLNVNVSDNEVVKMYEWMHSIGVDPGGPIALLDDAKWGRLESLKWLVNYGLSFNPGFAMDVAAQMGQLNVLRWFLETGVTACTTGAMNRSALNGDLETVKWLYADHKADFHPTTVACAASCGHLKMVQWLVQTGSDWDVKVAMVQAVLAGEIEILEWLYKNGEATCLGCVLREVFCQMPYVQVKSVWNSLRWLHAHHKSDCSNCLAPDREAGSLWIASYSAMDGELLQLQELHASHADQVESDLNGVAEAAVEGGHTAIVQWIHETFGERVDWGRLVQTAQEKNNELAATIASWAIQHSADG